MAAAVAAAVAAMACSGGTGGGAGGGSAGGTGGSGGSAGNGGSGGGAVAVLQSLSLAPQAVMLGVPEQQTLTATGHYDDGTTRDVTALAAWSSSQPSVASVSAGVVTAAMDGSALVTATLAGKSATLTVTVSGSALTTLAVTPDMLELGVGSAVQYVATGTFADGTKRNVSAEATWSSSAPAIATVSATGVVTAVTMGSSTVQAALRGKTSSVTSKVGAKTVTAIALTPPVLVLKRAETKQLTATATYSDGSTGDVTSAVTWSSDDGSGAVTVSAGGLLTAVSSLSGFSVHATLQGIEGIMRLRITNDGFALAGLIYHAQPMTRGLDSPPHYPDADFGGIGSTNFSQVVWTTSDPTVVELLPTGVWRPKKVGTSTMTALTYTATGTLMTSGTATVSEQTPDSITISSGATGAATLPQGTTLKLTATGTSTFFPTLNADLSSMVTWSSSNPGAVTVDSTGLARGVAQGSATITATLGSTMGTTQLTVPATVPPEQTVMLSTTEDNSVLISSISAGAETTVYPTNALFSTPGLAVGCTWFWNPPIGPAPERFDALCGRTLIKFDLAPLAGKTVVSAKLRLTTSAYGVGSVPRRWAIWALASTWSGSSVTWNSSQGFQHYVYSQTEQDPPFYVGQVFELDQTQTVKNWVSGAYVNAGWELGITNYLYPYVRYSSLDAFELCSREDSNGRGPKLIVTYR
ncbi:MAG: Ig-like domain-containing protein [Archangiaceae bacterium]|nr:Ig-like domain-containing protein [Archangiaceae bacterium]